MDNKDATHTHTHILTHTYARTHTRADTHARTHARTHTHTRTHTLKCQSRWFPAVFPRQILKKPNCLSDGCVLVCVCVCVCVCVRRGRRWLPWDYFWDREAGLYKDSVLGTRSMIDKWVSLTRAPRGQSEPTFDLFWNLKDMLYYTCAVLYGHNFTPYCIQLFCC